MLFFAFLSCGATLQVVIIACNTGPKPPLLISCILWYSGLIYKPAFHIFKVFEREVLITQKQSS
jgi:hypothetical protein